MMSSYGIGIAKVKINLCIRTVSSGASLDCSCPSIYSIVSINFISGQRSWSDWMTIKRWDNDVISSCLFQKNKRKKKEKIPCLPWNILTPYHTCPKNLTRSLNYLFIYLKLPDERHSVMILCSALGLHCLLRFWVNTVSANSLGSFIMVYEQQMQ